MEMPEPFLPLLEPIWPQMGQVSRLLQHALDEAGPNLAPALACHLDGGKHLRPALAILSGQALGAPAGPVVSLAAGLDLLHAATLVHDDLVDGSSLRRGRPALHTIWPLGAAVLAGDFFLAQSIALMAGLGRPRVLSQFGALLRALCLGEIRQQLTARAGTGSREDYYRSIDAKTASLFAAACEMAALLAGAAEPQIAALRDFGREFGLAFQIMDDVLDLTGSEAQLGKPAGGDLRQGLATLPILCYLERFAGETPVRAALANPCSEAQMQAAIAAIRSSGAVEDALDEARFHIRCAQRALAALPGSAEREILHNLAGYVLERGR